MIKHNRITKLLLLLLCTAFLCSCGQSTDEIEHGMKESGTVTEQQATTAQTETGGQETTGLQETTQNNSVTFTDALGNTVEIEHLKKTAVLSESLADAWLLAGGELAATTEDADAILEEHKMAVNLGAMKSPSVEMLIAEDIDLVILSAAISEHVKLKDTLHQAGIRTAYFDIETFSDYEEMMGVFAELTGNQEMYEENVKKPKELITEQIKRADGSRPTVLLLRAYSTGVKAKGSDSMVGQMLTDLDCENIADSKTGLLENLSLEAILEADPDYIFVTTMGNSKEAALSMMDELLISNPAWSGLTAVKNGHYHVLEKELFHNKPNNRWGESYQILADILYEEKQ